MISIRSISRSIFIWCLLLAATVPAQESDSARPTPPPPCSSPESRQFDFWVGEWDLTWSDSGRGENIITLELDSCVVEEHFTTLGEPAFRGNSVSIYNVKTGKWHQTWVDNQGGHFDLEGGMVDDRMILQCEAETNEGTPYLLRMVFDNITADSLDWTWERSDDRGDNWKVLWAIHYVRRQ